jgi:N-acetyl-alpha-D-muramate 1-phosphate uridylyltransferase
MYSIAILCGGLATRLHPVTINKPKSLIEINNIPFIEHQLKLLKNSGFEHVVICGGYMGNQIRDFVGNGEQYDLNIEYSFDGSKLLGTGGAIKKALKFLSDNFFVVYGDSYLPVDYAYVQQKYIEKKKLGLMTIYKNKDIVHANNVNYNGKRILQYNKFLPVPNMKYIDFGISILNKKTLDKFNEMCYHDLSDIFQYLIDIGELAGLPIKQRFYEIGSLKGQEELSKYLLEESL